MPTAIARLIFFVLQLLTFPLVGRAILSSFDPALRWPISRVLYDVTEPIVAPVRQILPRTGFLDLSLFVTLILLQMLQRLLAQSLA